MPIARLATVHLNYLWLPSVIAPTADCPPLVMVHGLATNLAFWYGLASQLAQTRPVLLYDLRGHGRSSMPPAGYTPAQQAADLVALLDHLQVDQVDLVGHSYGGAIALHAARQMPHRVRRLTLADVRLKLFQPQQLPREWPHWPRLQPVLARLGIPLDEADPEAGYRLLVEMARLQVRQAQALTTLPKWFTDFYPPGAGHQTAQRWLTLIETTQAWSAFVADDGVSLATLQALSQPVLMMYGEHSPTLVTGQRLHPLWPHHPFVLIPEAGHFFPLSKPEAAIVPLIDFLRHDSSLPA